MRPVLFVLAVLLAGCSSAGPGFAHHPVDCALGFPWSDCRPGTAGYAPRHGAGAPLPVAPAAEQPATPAPVALLSPTMAMPSPPPTGPSPSWSATHDYLPPPPAPTPAQRLLECGQAHACAGAFPVR